MNVASTFKKNHSSVAGLSSISIDNVLFIRLANLAAVPKIIDSVFPFLRVNTSSLVLGQLYTDCPSLLCLEFVRLIRQFWPE